MARIWKSRSAKGLTLVALAVTGAVAFLVNASAQDKDVSAKPTWMTAGFVRPGADAKVAEGAIDGQLGGTIYYAVYRLAQDKIDPTDPYGTGLTDLTKQFVAGSGTTKSPATLVPEKSLPKYLYLYQIVNDRGLEQPTSKDGIRLAANTEVKTRDIGSLILKLPVESSAIQSWGYFKNTGFSMNAIDRGGDNKARPASSSPSMQIAVSATPSILSKVRELNGGQYGRMASPVAFSPSTSFSVDAAGKNLKNTLFMEELSGRDKTKLVAWEKETMKAAEIGGDTPDSVEVMKFIDGDKAKAASVLRASFTGNPLKAGRHSVLIGFTSNMAPGMDLVRLQDVDAAKKGTGIRTVALDDIDFGAGGNIALPKEQAKDAAAAQGIGLRPSHLVVQGLVSPGDIPSGTKLVDKGAYRTFGGTVYFAVFKRNTTATGDTWGVGRSDFDSLFVPGESYRATFSPRLDTDAEFLYLYEVVNDRGFHDLKLPQNKATIIMPAANVDAAERAPITREVASFSLFLRTDPRLITSWGYFDDSGFNIKVADDVEIKQMANDPMAKPAGSNMAVSSNLAILDTLYPNKDKEYRAWSPPMSVDFGRTNLSVGKSTTQVNALGVRAVANDRAGSLRLVANKTLDKVAIGGGERPDYAQIIYFDGQEPVNGATIDGITLGPAEVARAIFKVEWLTKPIVEGHQSVVFGFTSNVEPIRAPVRIKDLAATINNSTEAQERTFLTPERIRAMAMNAIKGGTPVIDGQVDSVALGQGSGLGIGQAGGIGQGSAIGQAAGIAPGSPAAIALAGLNTDAVDAALAVADGLGNGIIPAGLGLLARGSVGTGIAISPSVATPNVGVVGEAASGGGGSAAGFAAAVGNTGSTSMGGGIGGGFGGSVGALGTARMPFFGGSGGGSGGSSGSSNQGSAGSSTSGSSGSNSGTNSGTSTNINFNVSQTNQQNQSQYQYQSQHQHQNQKGGNGGHCCNGNVVPAPASLVLALIGLPGFYLAYRRRRGLTVPENESSASTPQV